MLSVRSPGKEHRLEMCNSTHGGDLKTFFVSMQSTLGGVNVSHRGAEHGDCDLRNLTNYRDI